MNQMLLVVALTLVLGDASIAVEGHTGGYQGDSINRVKRVTPVTGPLRVSTTNSRYFSADRSLPIYLTGSHSGAELQDGGWEELPGEVLDYAAYLDLFTKYDLNLMRMWVWETTRLHSRDLSPTTPMPYKRSGPGSALDGAPKFDLHQFNQAYFDRLRSRVRAAQDRGIYVIVMLFQGFSIESKGSSERDPWPGHPFHSANNINGINGDANRNGEGEELHTLKIPAITRVQEGYIRKVIDTLNDLNNVLYEISNESHNQSTPWQYHMIRYIHDYEKSKPKQHPVVMSVAYPNGDNRMLFKSPAEAVSPNRGGGYNDDPPAADGSKIIIADTDHLLGMDDLDHKWVWKSFLRGLNPIFLDFGTAPGKPDTPKWQLIRRNLGYTRKYAQRISLTTMIPRNDLASSGYCLAHPGVAYLVYLPSGGTVSLDLRAATEAMRVEWFSPSTGEIVDAGTIKGGTSTELTSPFTRRFTIRWLRRNIDNILRTFGVAKPLQDSDTVLYLTADKGTPQP